MIGVLLINLGSPAAPTARAVRRYLREFLSDPRVVDLPTWQRWPLANLVIAPWRARWSAAAYRKIWTSAGSPLLVHGRALAAAVAHQLGDDYAVELAMRYGEPSIPEALRILRRKKIGELRVVPLYPQYAAASTGSSLAKLYQELSQANDPLPVTVIPPFFRHPGFLECLRERGRPYLEEVKPDHVLFSFHGLPERQILKSDPTGRHCLQTSDCCQLYTTEQPNCYRAHCLATAQALARGLGLKPEAYSLSFQSRLGRTPWLKPSTQEVVVELACQGKKRLLVFCPSFVADCLETLEEIGLRARDSFLRAGGELFCRVPAPNTHPLWVSTICEMVQGKGVVPETLAQYNLSC